MRNLIATIFLGLASLVAAQQAHLDPSVRDKILALISSQGSTEELPRRITAALQFTDTEAAAPLHQIGQEENATGATHVFAVVADTSNDLILINLKGDSALIYRALPNGRLLAAVSFVSGADKPIVLAPEEAQSGLNAEYSYWSKEIGPLADWLYCQGELEGDHPVTREQKRAACTRLIDSGNLTADDLAEAYIARSDTYDATKGEAPSVFADVTKAAQANPTSASHGRKSAPHPTTFTMIRMRR